MNSETSSIKRDLRREITDNIIDALEKGVAPWQKPWQAGAFEMPLNPTTGKLYRGGNALHLMVTGMRNSFEDPRWITYRQAQENGWQVRKGEKGTQIEFWQFPKNQAEGPEESKDNNPESSKDRFIYRVYTVFNGNQIDGIPDYAPRMRQEWEIVQGAESILQNSGAKILHDQPDRAFYNRMTDTIHLPPRTAFDSAGNYYGTALHETAHWTGAPHRLNRETLNNSHGFGDVEYAKEELRAELASVFLMAERGIPHNPDSHAAYVGSWLAVMREDKHELFRAARDAHKAADLLIALERNNSLDQALAHINEPQASIDPQPTDVAPRIIPSRVEGQSYEMEI